MGQQEYEAFKAKLREWMNTHPDEYAAFEEAMNARDYAGCQSVIFQAMSLIPCLDLLLFSPSGWL